MLYTQAVAALHCMSQPIHMAGRPCILRLTVTAAMQQIDLIFDILAQHELCRNSMLLSGNACHECTFDSLAYIVLGARNLLRDLCQLLVNVSPLLLVRIAYNILPDSILHASGASRSSSLHANASVAPSRTCDKAKANKGIA